MGDLYLTFLGPPEVRHADQVLLFSTRKELALLIYLAVEGRVHSRKKLSEQFWPEGDARHGRAALRITLLHLRHMLGEGADVFPVPHLLIKGDTLGLDLTSALELDLHILLEAWTLARASTHTTLTMPEEVQPLLLLTLRMGERAMPPGLTEWRTDLERPVPLTHLQLGPLASEDILRLLQAFGGRGAKTVGGPGTLWPVAVR